MIKVYVNDYLIPENDIISISDPATEKLKFNFQNLVSATISVDIDNIDIAKYDDEVQGSLLYGDWFNSNLRLVDTDSELTIWNGRIKNIKKNDLKATLTIESNNYIKEIVDTICEVNLGTLSNSTPSEIIYGIITGVCGIPVSAVNVNSFDNAKSLQVANQGYLIANYSKEANVNCGSVVNEILRITSSYLYTVDNILYYSQFQLYDGDHYTLVDENKIIAGTLASEYSADNIYNNYSMVYYSTVSAVAYATPDTTPTYITDSIAKYGEKKFLVPSDEVKETTPSAYKLLLKSLVSARYYGNLVRSSSHYAKKIVNLTISDSIPNVNLNSMIDVNYKHLQREPMRIIEKKINQKKKTITIKAEMVNFPFAVIDRDKEPPDAVILTDVKYGIENSVELYWTQSGDESFKQYIIEFSTSITDFEKEFSNEGYSPLSVVTPVIKEGLCTYKLSGLKENAIYYFRVKVMDLAWNIGNPSNVHSLKFKAIEKPYYTAEFYRCEGDVVNGLTFVDGVGTAPSGYTTYDDINYDSGIYSFAGYHVSKYFVCYGGFSKIVLKSSQLSKYYKVQVRRYFNGNNEEWLDAFEYPYSFKFIFDEISEIIQFRIIFKTLNYLNTYNIIIDQIN